MVTEENRCKKPASVLATVVCLLVPIQMVSQTWDDHDRSNRYVARDFGQNYLSTVQEEGNPIIFTNGDNDTFPLWYNQETEGFRTDVRVCNLSYLQTDWYIDQMKRQAYDSPAVPIDWSRLEYVQGHNEAVAIRPEVMESIKNFYKQNPEDAVREFGENPYELKNILKYWVRSPKEGLQMIPTDSIVIKLDKEAIKRSGMMIPDSLHGEIPEYMNISLKGKRMLYKSELMMLEMLANHQLGTSVVHGHHRGQRQSPELRQQLHSGRSCLPHHSVQYHSTQRTHRFGKNCMTT